MQRRQYGIYPLFVVGCCPPALRRAFLSPSSCLPRSVCLAVFLLDGLPVLAYYSATMKMIGGSGSGQAKAEAKVKVKARARVEENQ